MNPTVLTLTNEEAQIVVNALAQRPFAEVANLIPKSMAQHKASQTPTQPPMPDGHVHGQDSTHAVEDAISA